MTDNTFCNYFFGYFGWQFNREANLLFMFGISLLAYVYPEMVMKPLGLSSASIQNNYHTDDIRLQLVAFVFLYGTFTILMQTFAVTQQLKQLG